jgi:gluconolactonase
VEPILTIEHATVFVDGTLGPTRLKHPEGLAVASDGAIWCGGEGGEIYRVEPDGSTFEQVATTGGFTLGVAFDPAGRLYTCDLAHQAVFRYDPSTGDLTKFATGGQGDDIRVPNAMAVDGERGLLYVSDSYGAGEVGPGIWRFDLESGSGFLWYRQVLNFANGIALSPSGDAIYVAETFGHRVSRIPIRPDGTAGEADSFVTGIDRLPDGLAFDVEGNLYVSCYEPSRIYRVSPGGQLALLIDDPDAHMLCHPTNCAFRGTELFTANLGRWHITRIEAGVNGAPLI